MPEPVDSPNEMNGLTDYPQSDLPPDIEGEIRQAQMLRLRHVACWQMIAAFIQGDQLSGNGPPVPASINGTAPFTNVRAGQNRSVWNNLQALDRIYCSLLSPAYPKVQFTPSSAEVASMLRARSTDECGRYMWRAERLAEKLHTGNRYLSRQGMYAWHIYFDQKAGCIRWDMVPAFDIFFEKYASSVEQSSWRARRHILRRRDAVKMFPGESNKLSAPLGIDSPNPEERLLEDRIELFQVYTQDGVHAMVCSGGVLFKTMTPQGIVPFVPVGNTMLDNTCYPQAALYPLLDPQVSLNSAVNSVIDTLRQYGRPRLLVPTSAEVNQADINNGDGPIRYSGMTGDRPAFLQGAQPPPGMFEFLTRTQAAMNDLSGIHGTTQGKPVSGVTSGVAINSLSQNDIGQLQNVKNNIEKGFCEAMRCALTLWQTFVTEPVAVSMLDPAMGHVVSTEINSAHFFTNPNVFVEAGSLFASYQTEREQRWLSLLQVQAITPQQYLDLLAEGSADRDGRKRTLDMFRAQKLLESVQHGVPIAIFPNDPTKVIAEVFGEFMETPAYYEPATHAAIETIDTQDPVHAAEYYRQREICEEIKRVYLAVTLPPNTDPATMQMLEHALVYPRTFAPPMGGPSGQQGPMPPTRGAGSAPTGQPSPSNMPTGNPSGPVPVQNQTADQIGAGQDKLSQAIGQAG